MKTIISILSIIFLFSFNANAQCNCDTALSSDLLTVTDKYNESKFREFLYNYFKASKTERRRMKKNYSNSFGLKAVVKNLPLEFNSSNNSSRDSQEFYAFEQQVINNHYVSNTILQSVATRYLSNNQLNAYKACLQACPSNNSGITFTSGGDEFDIFYTRITFNGVVPDSKVELLSDVQYSGCVPIHSLSMKKGTEIKNGQDLVQYFKRTNKNITANISLQLNGVNVDPITLNKKEEDVSSILPIGTIISSTLSFSEFQSQITDKAFDKAKSNWAPCDGRGVIGSIYSSKYQKDFTPDLRGQFLRGNYTMGGPSEPSQNTPNGINPRDNETIQNTYIYQKEQLKRHSHSYSRDLYGHRAGRGRGNANVPKSQNGVDQSPRVTGETGSTETRPMNMYVYYYIKIN